MLLSSIDLSSLEQWDMGPAGAAEADATRSEILEELEASQDEPEFSLEPESASASASASASESEIEAEPAFELEGAGEETGGSPSDLDRYLGPWIAYRPFAAFDRGRVIEELVVVGEGQPWAEAEFLGEDEEVFGGAEGGIIEYRDGIFRLNTDKALAGGESSSDAAEDSAMRALVDSVLGGDV